MLHSICQQIWKTQQWPRAGKSQFSFQYKEGQCQRMFTLLYNCTHFTCQQSNVQNSPSQASVVHKQRTFRCSSWFQKRQKNQRSNCQHSLDHRKAKRFPEEYLLVLHINYAKAFDCVDNNKLWKILQEMGISDHLSCLLRNLYAGQEATIRAGHAIDWFQIGKGVHQGCVLSPCLFNLSAEFTM